MFLRGAPWAVMVALAAGCAGELADDIGESSHALEAYCEAEVSGSGTLDVENDYIPQVVACENGGASLEALKAQAVAARTYLYYKLRRQGSIGDGQGDQVYTCGNPAGDKHRKAAAETSGQVLRYQQTIIAAFYVAGALQSGPDCRGGSSDPTGTEHYVTYNEGKTGDQVEQTTLGWVDPGNLENRGCQSQNGAHCLSDEGWDYDSILRYFYGEDIDVTTAKGPCVEGGDDDEPPPPDEEPESSSGLIGGCAVSQPGSSLAPLLFLALAAMRRRRRTRES
jgi:MYXO-CTERM domain-containing protein